MKLLSFLLLPQVENIRAGYVLKVLIEKVVVDC